MILLIDNYDSFSYNLYQLIGTIESDIQVVRNDELSLEDIHKLNPQAIVLSTGPGHPHEEGIIESVIKQFYRSVPILGICLGHQAICEVFQSEITYAKELMHGKTSLIYLQDDVLFQGLEKSIQVARYHSLIVKNISKDLKVIAKTSHGEIMAVKHNLYPVYGLQFHPESILTNDGLRIILNFIGGMKK